MNLIVSQRAEDRLLRFTVSGSWGYNDALALAYQVKAAAARTGLCNVLMDLREVVAGPGVEGRFLLWDRLGRALPGECRVALLAPADLVEVQERPLPGAPSVVLFNQERAALLWLAAIKNPPVVLRSEGQVAGKET